MKVNLKKEYVLVSDVKGDGVVDVVIRRKDGSEEDAIVGQTVDGTFTIPSYRGLGEVGKLVYELNNDEEFDICVSKENKPTDEDYRIIQENDLARYLEIEGVDADPDAHVPDSLDVNNDAIAG